MNFGETQFNLKAKWYDFRVTRTIPPFPKICFYKGGKKTQQQQVLNSFKYQNEHFFGRNEISLLVIISKASSYRLWRHQLPM